MWSNVNYPWYFLSGANVRTSRCVSKDRDNVFDEVDTCNKEELEFGLKKKKKKKKKKDEEEEEEESKIDPIPIVCAVMIASVFGGHMAKKNKNIF